VSNPLEASGGSGEPLAGSLARLTGASSQAEAEMIEGLLSEAGIPVLVRLVPGFDVSGLLAAGPRELLVREADLQQARALVESHFGLDRPFS
jgi:hypothetical protein